MAIRKAERFISTSMLCLCALTALSGCIDLNRQILEKVTADQMPKVSTPKQELPAVKAQEPKKTESVKQEIAEKKNEADDLPPQDAYGSIEAIDTGMPGTFANLPRSEKAALHWAAAQEYWKMHNTKVTYQEAIILAEIHGMSPEEILHKVEETPGEQSTEVIHALPHRPKSYEKWRAKTIGKYHLPEERNKAVAELDQAQKDEQQKSSPNRRGCEWMTGKYYIDRNPSSLCTPVIGECIEGNCKNGHGTYAFSDGSKYVGEFKNTKPNGQGTKTWAIGLSYMGEFTEGVANGKGKYTLPARHKLSEATCLEGDCNNGQGVLMYENDTKYIGQFAYGKPHGKGIYYWRTGEALEGWFTSGWLDKGENHISPDGTIVVQDQQRTWHKTYREEEIDAKMDYAMKHKAEVLYEGYSAVIQAERAAKEAYCGGHPHGRKNPDYDYCGY